MRSGLINSFFFGLRPLEFLRLELALSPLQKLIAKRIFITLMLLALIMESTRMPSSRAVGAFIAIMLPALMVTTRMAYDVAAAVGKLLLLGLLSGMLILMITLDQGWMRLPLSIAIIVLMLFDGRLRRIQSIAPIFFGTIALYNAEQPAQGIDTALWDIVTLLGPLLLAMVLSAHVLWPIKAIDVLDQRIMLRMQGLDRLLKVLTALGPEDHPAADMPRSNLTPGWTSDALRHLDDALRDDPEMQAHHHGWLSTVMELDALDVGLSDYYRLWLDAEIPVAISPNEHAIIEAIAQHFTETRAVLVSHGKQLPPDDSPHPAAIEASDIPQILKRQYLGSLRLKRAAVAIYREDETSDTPPTPSPPPAKVSFFERLNAEENRPILLWALKVGIACFLVSLIVESLDANTIDTAILTTIIVADSTLGADFRKSLMRVSGAISGAILGILWLILGQPISETIAGFLVTVSPFLAICAWFGATGPRLSYVGIQMGLAFSLIVFSEFEPGTYLGAGWYRFLGILLGISVMGFVDYLLWPARSLVIVRLRLIQSLKVVVSNLRKNPERTDFTEALSVAQLRLLDQSLTEASYLLNFARMEPGAGRPGYLREVCATSAIIEAMHFLSKITAARHRLYIDCRAMLGGHLLDELHTPLKSAYAEQFEAMAMYLQSGIKSPHLVALEDELEIVIGRLQAYDAFRTLSVRERFHIDALIDLEQKHARALSDLREQIEDNLASRAIPVSG